MNAIIDPLKAAPLDNPDAFIPLGDGLVRHTSALVEEARQICLDISDGKDLVLVAKNTTDLSAYAVGSMIAKISLKSLKPGGVLPLKASEGDVFDTLDATFTPERLAREEDFRFNRRTVFDVLEAEGMVSVDLTVRDVKPAGTLPTISEISRIIENYEKASLEEIQSPARTRDIVRARFIAIWVMRYVCGHSLTYIGEQLGNRDHTSILNGVNRIRAMRAGSFAERNLIDRICDEADALAMVRHHNILLRQSVIRRVS